MKYAAGKRLGTYEIIAPLGAGGMGEVYRARDTNLKRDVAIKSLPDEFSSHPDRIARFQREAEALAALNHPNIAHIYDLQQSDGERFLVLELVEGETLAERIGRGPIPMTESLEIAKQIAEAVEAAHERGIIHRDLKPANIKLAPDGRVKVLDFGLAKMRPSAPIDMNLSNSPTMTASTTQGMIVGSVGYMSPEVVKGKEADRSSDVWAFGCILYEMLTGSTTFEGDSVGEILAAVFQAEPTWGRLPSNAPEGVRRPFRGVGAELRISTNGGTQPRWRRDGRELFYIAGDDRLNAVSIRFASEGTAVEADAPVPLFARQLARALGNFRQQYMPSSDGQRFLINAVTQEATSSPITIIINWKPQS